MKPYDSRATTSDADLLRKNSRYHEKERKTHNRVFKKIARTKLKQELKMEDYSKGVDWIIKEIDGFIIGEDWF